MLPVVSDLAAKISPKSTLKALGKTPSMFNRNGEVVGLPQWSQKKTTDGEIGRWARDIRLGICIQCRVIRAIDIDIADQAVVDDIIKFITLVTGELPMRTRSNSGKSLIVFHLAGEFVKRVIHTAHGVIEFLANGQQFIAVGTHTSGVRYEWSGGLPEVVPEVTQADFAAVWTSLQEQYGIEPERVARESTNRPKVPRKPGEVEDHIATFLEANNWVKSWADDGTINIRCPFEEEHSNAGDENESESATKYFPAGVGGYALGHWKCLHGHCVARQDHEYTDKIGLLDSEFEDLTTGTALTAEGTAIVVAAPGPAFVRRRDGTIKTTIGNLVKALRAPDVCDMKIAWDNFRDELMWASTEPGADDWRPFRDQDYVRLRMYLEENGFVSIGREIIRDAVHAVAVENQFDTAQLWCESNMEKWDGVARIQHFYSTYFGAADTPYTRAVGLYTWSALAGRALEPGIKADMAIILKSEQGTNKTEGIRAMAPHEDQFGEIDLHKSDDVLARVMRGKLVCELSELRGMNSRDAEAIKSWVSRRYEEWVPKFKEFATKFPRRVICFGTTNEDEFLADSTGERRWLPMEVGRTDLQALKRDCEQLWAEGAHLFKQSGIQWQEAERLAKREHAKFKVHDSWMDIIGTWLDEEDFGQTPGVRQGDKVLRLHEVLGSALGMQPQNITRKDELRLAKVLRTLGYENFDFRVGGQVLKAWVNRERMDTARRARKELEDIA